MSTQSLVTRIQPYAQGRPITGNGGILELIQRAQNELFSYDSLGLRFVPPDNKGFPSYLLTTAGVYKYDIKSANLSSPLAETIGSLSYSIVANKILRVFVDATIHSYNGYVTSVPYGYRFGAPFGPNITRMQVANVPVKTSLGLETTPPSVQFFEDPGTTTDKYFVEMTFRPPTLSSVNIPLMIPIDFEQAIFDYCVGDIRGLENGNPNELQNKFETKWKPEFRRLQSEGVQYEAKETTPIDC